MNIVQTKISDLVIIEPMVFGDHRGYFLESFNNAKFSEHVKDVNFIQDNESKSTKGVLRGLHFQKPPYAQAKLVRCIEGKVLDIAVDIRKGSPTFGQYEAVELSGENKRQLFVPRGFAHGYIVLSDHAIFSYKVDNLYAPEYEGGIMWNDKQLNVDWNFNVKELILSDKDKKQELFENFDSPFTYSL